MNTGIKILQSYHLTKVRDGEPDPVNQYDVLAHTDGVGWRILRWRHQTQRWEVLNNDGSTVEDVLAIHHWTYLL
jgi:hypothetical protein